MLQQRLKAENPKASQNDRRIVCITVKQRLLNPLCGPTKMYPPCSICTGRVLSRRVFWSLCFPPSFGGCFLKIGVMKKSLKYSSELKVFLQGPKGYYRFFSKDGHQTFQSIFFVDNHSFRNIRCSLCFRKPIYLGEIRPLACVFQWFYGYIARCNSFQNGVRLGASFRWYYRLFL